MNKKLALAVLIAILIISASLTILMKKESKPSSTLLVVSNYKITLDELKIHNDKDDCWISYQKKVYDVTSYLPKHPGSAQAIIPYCGTAEEFEKAFTSQHGTSKVGLLQKMGIYKGELE